MFCKFECEFVVIVIIGYFSFIYYFIFDMYDFFFVYFLDVEGYRLIIIFECRFF